MNDNDLIEQQAVDAAINLDWDTAIAINKQIIKRDKTNLGAYLRLGFAYIQLGQLPEAKKMYHHVLKIQSENQIALDHLDRIAILENKGATKPSQRQIRFDPSLFLEIAGKTKSVALVNLGQKNILAELLVGEEVVIKPKKIKAEIRTKNNEYIGTLADDLSKRIFLFTKAGSEYSCFIKEVSLNRVVVFIREDKKGKKVARYTSFPKNIQTNMMNVGSDDQRTGAGQDENEDFHGEHGTENELERLAENLPHEIKDIYSFTKEEEDEENLEE